MGEFHFARYPENEWRDELLKMKAGGIDIVVMPNESMATAGVPPLFLADPEEVQAVRIDPRSPDATWMEYFANETRQPAACICSISGKLW